MHTFPGGFTVLMAVHRSDDAPLFRKALRSVLDNLLAPDLVLVVADGPLTEELERILTECAAASLRVVRHDRNKGLAKALNTGLALIETEWTVRADADDVNLPHRFSTLASAASGRAVDVLGSAILEVDDTGIAIAVRRPPTLHTEIVAYARRRNPFNHMSVAFRTSLVRNVGGYPDLDLREDYGLWATLIHRNVRTANVEDVLVHATAGTGMYRRRGGVRSVLAEAALQRHLVALSMKGRGLALWDLSVRALVFLLPAHVRGALYRMFLRESPR